MMVQVPLIVDARAGVNDMLDRDGSRTPVQFHIANDHDAAPRSTPRSCRRRRSGSGWRSQQFGMRPGEGICTDMRAVRKDYFLDHDHSAYVDQWDWERVDHRRGAEPRLPQGRRQPDLEGARRRRAHTSIELFPQLTTPRYPNLPEELTFLHAEEILDTLPGPAAQAAGDPDPPGVPGRLHLSGSAGRSPTATRTRCGPPTTTTGSRDDDVAERAGRCTASTATSWCGTR